MKPETRFRKNKVIPFLLKLKNTAFFPIQQLCILGDADFLLCVRGDFVWLELKDTNESLRPLQRKKANWVEKCGGKAIVADPENWDAVADWLTALDAGAGHYADQIKVLRHP